jgi:threonine/homoserine/homoserine lactone efflux protein
MGKAIGEILPYAVAAAISGMAIVAIILMLVTPKAKTNGTAFAVGYVLGFALVGTIVLVLAGGSDYSSGSGPTQTVSIIKLLLGLLLLVAAARQWRGRPLEGEAPKLPKWMGAIDSFTAGKSFGIGVLLSAVNPKNLAMSLAAGLAIAQAAIPTGQEAVVLIIYIVISTSTVLAPVRVLRDGRPGSGDPRQPAEVAGGEQRRRHRGGAARISSRADRAGHHRPVMKTIRLAASTVARGERQPPSRDRAKPTHATKRMQVIENDRYRTTTRNQAVDQLVHGRFDPAPRAPRDIGAGPIGPRPNRSTAVARCVHDRRRVVLR